MAKKIAINGFGRIGRSIVRSILHDENARSELEIAAINVGPCLFENLGHLFKYDSVMGIYPGDVTFKNNELKIDELTIPVLSEPNPACINWKKHNIEWVIESSGCFTHRKDAACHLEAGAKKVLITAPAHDEDATIVPGVNDSTYDAKKHDVISLGSCTTNCFAPVIKVLLDNFGIAHGIMTTTHAYTNNQVLLDVEHKDPRRARAAAINIIPTHTGAAKTILKVFPQLSGKLHATALRVPVPKVSLLDFTFIAEKEISVETINATFHEYSLDSMKDILAYSQEPLVSSDYANTPYAAIIDSQLTIALENMGKVFAWYDNEYGYSCRVRDFLVNL